MRPVTQVSVRARAVALTASLALLLGACGDAPATDPVTMVAEGSWIEFQKRVSIRIEVACTAFFAN